MASPAGVHENLLNCRLAQDCFFSGVQSHSIERVHSSGTSMFCIIIIMFEVCSVQIIIEVCSVSKIFDLITSSEIMITSTTPQSAEQHIFFD